MLEDDGAGGVGLVVWAWWPGGRFVLQGYFGFGGRRPPTARPGGPGPPYNFTYLTTSGDSSYE